MGSTSLVLFGLMVIGNPLTSTGIQPISFHGFTTTVQSKTRLSLTIVGALVSFANMEIFTLARIVTIQVLFSHTNGKMRSPSTRNHGVTGAMPSFPISFQHQSY